MRKTLEDLYLGNIIPGEKCMAAGSELRRAVKRAADCEELLTKELNETEQRILGTLVSVQHEINSITAMENFILGFRLGVQLIAECMDENDGSLVNGGG